MKKLILIFLWAGMVCTLNAQPLQDFKFLEMSHDFGVIEELDGPVEFQFDFTNIGAQPVNIVNVRASCGCTTPGWTRDPVASGEKGYIKAVYNPTNRPGPFNKTLTVTTTGTPTTIVLRIRGRVEPRPRTVEDDFPTVLGAIRVKYRAFNMGRVMNNASAVKEFGVYNQSQKAITFLSAIEGPSYIQVNFVPIVLESEQRGKIVITYDGLKRNDLGFMSDNIVFRTDEQGGDARKPFSVYADIYEYFPPMSVEEMAEAPKLTFEKTVFDFGKINQGEKVSTEFVLINAGKSPLNIRKTKSSCSCTDAKLDKETLQPDEHVTMQVSFNSTGRRGTQQKSITIYSNDPTTPVQRVTIKASIVVPKQDN